MILDHFKIFHFFNMHDRTLHKNMGLFLKKKERIFIIGQHFFFSSDSNQNYIGFTPFKKEE